MSLPCKSIIALVNSPNFPLYLMLCIFYFIFYHAAKIYGFIVPNTAAISESFLAIQNSDGY
jgi:hypothetical protein